jgi:DNA modification methylase
MDPETGHRIVVGDARELPAVAPRSVHLIVTSPPYPGIEMWDESFRSWSGPALAALDEGDAAAAREAMHRELDRVWRRCAEVLVPGGILCLNIGDATRSLRGRFSLWPNRARATAGLEAAGFTILPGILWRKPTNAPNKFLGSGMLPPGAYVTYEHEAILIARMGGPREFPTQAAKARRLQSAFFWEERNVWFSDIWLSLVGQRQALEDPTLRQRSGAFPFELPWRLIQMHSLYGDTVLDPFAGTGTTAAAAAASGRSSVSVEWAESLLPAIRQSILAAPALGRSRTDERVAGHLDFVARREALGKSLSYRNAHHGWPVMTRQETELRLCWTRDAAFLDPHRARATHAFDLPEASADPAERPARGRPAGSRSAGPRGKAALEGGACASGGGSEEREAPPEA